MAAPRMSGEIYHITPLMTYTSINTRPKVCKTKDKLPLQLRRSTYPHQDVDVQCLKDVHCACFLNKTMLNRRLMSWYDIEKLPTRADIVRHELEEKNYIGIPAVSPDQ